MPTIRRIAATEQQIAEARAERFSAGYGFSNGRILVPQNVGFCGHDVDGTAAKKASPVITLEGTTEVIYVKSLVKERCDYKNQIVPIKGTLNQFAVSLLDGTIGELIDTLNDKLKGKKIKALRLTYQGIDRNGEVRTIAYNEYDIE